jgi:hypothetical protein
MSSEVETSLTILREFLVRDCSSAGSSLRSTPLFSIATISQLLFTRDGVLHVRAMLVVDQFSAPIIRGKPGNFTGAMFTHPTCQIIGHANVEGRVVIIGHDVDPEVVVPPQSEIVRDSSTTLGMTKRPGGRCERHRDPVQCSLLSCRAKSRHL